MSASKLANKVARAAERKRLRNRLARRSVKTLVVRAKSSVAAGEEAAYQKTMLAISGIDKAVRKGIIHRNKGSRLKSQLMKLLYKKQSNGN
ncbi:MAG: 30S ribosomal protein S20 [Dehalococcoidia bacterium]